MPWAWDSVHIFVTEVITSDLQIDLTFVSFCDCLFICYLKIWWQIMNLYTTKYVLTLKCGWLDHHRAISLRNQKYLESLAKFYESYINSVSFWVWLCKVLANSCRAGRLVFTNYYSMPTHFFYLPFAVSCSKVTH